MDILDLIKQKASPKAMKSKAQKAGNVINPWTRADGRTSALGALLGRKMHGEFVPGEHFPDIRDEVQVRRPMSNDSMVLNPMRPNHFQGESVGREGSDFAVHKGAPWIHNHGDYERKEGGNIWTKPSNFALPIISNYGQVNQLPQATPDNIDEIRGLLSQPMDFSRGLRPPITERRLRRKHQKPPEFFET